MLELRATTRATLRESRSRAADDEGVSMDVKKAVSCRVYPSSLRPRQGVEQVFMAEIHLDLTSTARQLIRR